MVDVHARLFVLVAGLVERVNQPSAGLPDRPGQDGSAGAKLAESNFKFLSSWLAEAAGWPAGVHCQCCYRVLCDERKYLSKVLVNVQVHATGDRLCHCQVRKCLSGIIMFPIMRITNQNNFFGGGVIPYKKGTGSNK